MPADASDQRAPICQIRYANTGEDPEVVSRVIEEFCLTASACRRKAESMGTTSSRAAHDISIKAFFHRLPLDQFSENISGNLARRANTSCAYSPKTLEAANRNISALPCPQIKEYPPPCSKYLISSAPRHMPAHEPDEAADYVQKSSLNVYCPRIFCGRSSLFV